jgi:peptidyl-prolyl cis-trans isomerase SurA
MYRKFIIFSLLLLPLCAVAQQNDPVVLRVNDKTVTRSEIEYKLNKEHLGNLKGKALKSYVETCADNLLKVCAAEASGIDTSRVIRNDILSYRKDLLRTYLANGQTDEDYARMLYDRMREKNHIGDVQIMQIYKHLPQNASSLLIETVKQRMDSIYSALVRQPEKFQWFVQHYSDQKDTQWVSFLDKPVDFEKQIYALSDNHFTEPFYSPAGIFIVKVISHRPMAPFEEMKGELISLLHSQNSDEKTELLVDRLKNEVKYVSNVEGLDDLYENGSTNKTLFTLDGKAYSGSDFQLFSKSHPMEVKSQVEAFTTKSILDYQAKKIEAGNSSFALQMKLYRDDILTREEDDIAVPQSPDSLSVSSFYDRHKADYKWDVPHFYGAVIYCVNNKIGKKVRKKLKKNPKEEWTSLIESFNRSKEVVRMEQGAFAEGSNAAVDYFEFNKEGFTPPAGLPYTALVGEKKKYPEDYREIYATLVAGYQKEMKQQWIEHLRNSGKVEISEEVLKTVNNHR